MKRITKKQREQFKLLSVQLGILSTIMERPIETIDISCVFKRVEKVLDELVKFK